MTYDEYNHIMEQSRVAYEEHAQKEKKFLVENADELAAKYNREKLKQRRAEYEAKQREKAKKEEDQQDTDRKVKKEKSEVRVKQESSDDEPRETMYSGNYTPAAPFGKWQTVEKKEEKFVDLQLPEQNRNIYVPVVNVPVEPKPKVFKEKVATLDKETTETESGVFKKRKININLKNKKNSRQRLEGEDY